MVGQLSVGKRCIWTKANTGALFVQLRVVSSSELGPVSIFPRHVISNTFHVSLLSCLLSMANFSRKLRVDLQQNGFFSMYEP